MRNINLCIFEIHQREEFNKYANTYYCKIMIGNSRDYNFEPIEISLNSAGKSKARKKIKKELYARGLKAIVLLERKEFEK